MNRQEYEKVKDLSYGEYCDYLSRKYEGVDRTGLFRHHTYENIKANLSNPEVAKYATDEERNTITPCSFDEHALLHILIGEQTDARKALGLGGAVNYIIPQLREYFEHGKMCYSPDYYKDLDREVFDILVRRCDDAVRKTNIALDHNRTVYLQAERYLQEKGKALVVIGTGLGKTTTALEYLWSHKCRALVIGPNNIIRNGWEEYPDWCDVTTYQSFANNYPTIDYSKYGLVILDEAHHAGYDEDTGKGAAVWSKGIRYIIEQGIKVLGLTATPERSDNIDIGDTVFDGCVCEGFAVEDGIEKGIIHPFSYITAYYDTDGISERYSDCQNRELVGQLDLAINNTPTVKDIFRKHMPDNKRKGIIFIQEIADEQKVVDIMKDVYPKMEMRIIHSRMDEGEVRANRKWFEETDEGYLLAVNMISEGAHYKGVNTLIMFRKTSSYLVFTQQIGRIITLTRNENPNAIVFDLVNNIENIEYNNRKQDKKQRHSVSDVARELKKTEAFKSGQIIVADETRDIVRCIREIKEFEYNSWLDWEDDILKKYYPTEGSNCLDRINKKRKELGLYLRTRNSINHHCSNLKIECEEYFWSKKNIELLRQYYPTEGTSCYKRFNNMKESQIRSAAIRYKIYRKKLWSLEEDSTMVKYYPTEGGDCYKRLQNKTKQQTMKHARLLNLKANTSMSSADRWTKEDDNIIREYYPIEGKKCYKRISGTTESTVTDRACFLGVKYINSKVRPRRVMCMETGEIFNTMTEAGKKYKTTKIGLVCSGNKKTAGKLPDGTKLHWKYAEE